MEFSGCTGRLDRTDGRETRLWGNPAALAGFGEVAARTDGLDVSGAVETLPALPLDDVPNTEHQRKTAVAGCEPASVAPSVALNDGKLGRCMANTGKPSGSRGSARSQAGSAVSVGLTKRNDPLTSVANGSKHGADEIRTHDLLHAMQALSQLSYGPVCCGSQRIQLSVQTAVRLGRVVLPRTGCRLNGEGRT
jgi:hypothetical protein